MSGRKATAMAEKKTEVAKVSENVPALAAGDFGGGMMVEGLDQEGPQLSKVVLYHGTTEEEAEYGEHKRGQFLDALESRELGDKIKIMPVHAWATWTKWQEGQKQPLYSFRDKSLVPAADLIDRDSNGDWMKPAAQMAINMVVVVEGESWPYLLIFKRTALKAYDKTIRPIEARRSMTNKTPGMYELATIDDKSDEGKPYKRLVARSLGDPTPELATLGKQVYDSIERVRQQAEAMADDDMGGTTAPAGKAQGNDNGNDIPF